MDILELRERLEKAWSIETTYCPDNYRGKDSSWGQCAVTAMVVYHKLGGSLMQGMVETPQGYFTRHFWNRIRGLDVDLTWRQFPIGTTLTKVEYASRGDLVYNAWMEERLTNLYKNFNK